MLRRIMAEAFEMVVGGKPKISIETYLAPTADDDEFMDLSLDVLLATNGVGHEWRLRDCFCNPEKLPD